MAKENLAKVIIKGSFYNFISNAIAKLGGIVFTIFILARLLGPELFGIYNLAFSIISIILVFSTFGIGDTATRFIAEALSKKSKIKARSYFKYLIKIQGIVTILAVAVLLIIAKPIAFNFYDKPALFYPLIIAALYVFAISLYGIIQSLFYAIKDISKFPLLNIIEQVLQIGLALLAILFLSDNLKISGIFFGLGISILIVLILSLIFVFKKDRDLIIGPKTKIEKSSLLKYIVFMGATTLSLVVFGSVDTLMLGKFVDAAYMGYYRAALGLVLSISAILSVAFILLPIFSQIDGERLKRGFVKVTKYVLIFAIPFVIGLLITSKFVIGLLYGSEYLPAIVPLWSLSFLILVVSLLYLYKPVFQAKEKAKIIAIVTVIALVINIVLNFILITWLIQYGQVYAILGAGIATTLSKLFLVICLAVKSKKEFGIKIPGINFVKPLIASLIMIIFLIGFAYFIDINTFTGIVQIIGGIIIYFLSLFLIKGIRKEDFKLLKYLPVFGHKPLLKTHS
ncbi:MAG: flippase [Patescibacteria group bacterium]